MKKFVECDLLRAMQFFSKKTRKYNAKKETKWTYLREWSTVIG